MPGHKDYRYVVLPAFLTKSKVYSKYATACEKEKMPFMSQRVFLNYWNELHPRIINCNPRTDLCFTCQKNVSLLLKSRNKDLDTKLKALLCQEEHTKLA